MIGGKIENFMLEKSRICQLSYHIFRIIFGSSTELRKKLSLNEVFKVDLNFEINQLVFTWIILLYFSKELYIKCFENTLEEDEQSAPFRHFDIALEKFNMNENQKAKLYQLIAGILNLSKIEFEDKNGILCVRDNNALHNVSHLFSINAYELIETLTIKRIGVGNNSDDKIRWTNLLYVIHIRT